MTLKITLVEIPVPDRFNLETLKLISLTNPTQPVFDSHEFKILNQQDELVRLRGEVEALQKVADAAKCCVQNPAWVGVCDEDLLLEAVIAEFGKRK